MQLTTAAPRRLHSLPSIPPMRVILRVVTLALVLAAALVGAPRAAGAQASTTTGAIRGRATDEGGQPMLGAVVTATNQETGLARSAQTAEDGTYVIRLLPPGTYTVGVRRLGSQPQEQRNVAVALSQTAQVNFSLKSVSVTLSTVQVTASQQVDVADAGVKQLVSQEEIQNLPALGRDFTDFINLSGLVSPTPEATTGGQFSIAGQRPSQTSIQIDGVDANNAFFGENRGGSRIPFSFSLESIREFQIVTNGYDVEYGNYSGGVVNIVTRGGTNQFKGSGYGNFRNQSLTGKNFNGSQVNDFSAVQYAASVEGPIKTDKLFYLFSLDGQRRREPYRSWSPDYLRGSTNATQQALGDSLQRFIDIMSSTYGVGGVGSTFGEWSTSNDVLTLFGRLDYTINGKHRLSLRNNFATYTNADETFSGAFRGGRSTAEVIKDKNNSLVGELQSEFGRQMYNTLRMQYAYEDRPRVGNDLRPSITVNLTPSDSLTYGGNRISFRNGLTEQKVQLVDNFTVTRGAHTFKLGTNNTLSHEDNLFWLAGSGVYTFRSLADLQAGRPSGYTRSVPADSQAPRAKFNVQDWSAYAQDDWQLTPKMLATLGLRYDVTRYGNAPGRVIDVERAFGYPTGIAPVDKNNFSPRLSLTYDVHGDATEVVRAGGGLFYGRVPYVLGSNVAQTEVPIFNLVCNGSLSNDLGVPDPDAPPPFDYASWSASGNDNPFGCYGGGGIGGTPTYTLWSKDFALPETFKGNVGYEKRLTERTGVSLDLLATVSRKLYTVRNINLRDYQFVIPGEANRRVFVPELVPGTTQPAFNPSSGAGVERLRNTEFSDIYVNYNDGIARSFAGTVNLDHRFANNTQLRGSYTYTWAYDNNSFSCCTSNEGFQNTRVGALGPNYMGGAGDEDAGWGPSAFERRHTFVFSGIVRLPWDVRATTIWRMQSGTPWGPEQSGDLNGDGVRFNDRPFVFKPSELPVYVAPGVVGTDSLQVVAQNRATYAGYLNKYACVGDFVGRIIARNSCRQPWYNRLDLSLRKSITTVSDQRAELQVDLFNVLNGLNSKWGHYEAVSSANRNLLTPRAYDPATQRILYTVPTTFGQNSTLGSNLLLQFSAQIGIRYSF